MKNLIWFRNDLRLWDNPALHQALQGSPNLIAVYVFCEEYLARHSIAATRVDFIRRHLLILAAELGNYGIPLQLIAAERARDIPELVLSLMQREQCSGLFFNAEYPFDELERDRAVVARLRSQNLVATRCHDRVILPPESIRNTQGEPYKVFTAFKRRWLQTIAPIKLASLPYPLSSRLPDAQFLKGNRAALAARVEAGVNDFFTRYPCRNLSLGWPAGEAEAGYRLQEFLTNHIDDYHNFRDFPAKAGTSTLSPYLAIGAISSRQCFIAALQHNGGEWDSGNPGVLAWINELIWREFYQHLVVDFPHICKNCPMQSQTELFPWRRDKDLFQRWCDGTTGIPIVDAAMRQLQETGWMHNRLRMITAMFLTKNLQIDWRWGEKYFMSQLIDGDFSANNGGWQWCASTGTDAAPYFRVFNPISQSQRFDPEGAFIRRYLPELSHCTNRQIHQPPPDIQGYPLPIVDLASSRRETIELFARLK